jgi:hypothetical protein
VNEPLLAVVLSHSLTLARLLLAGLLVDAPRLSHDELTPAPAPTVAAVDDRTFSSSSRRVPLLHAGLTDAPEHVAPVL